jgi:phosphoribosylamine--glycine ligase
MASANYPETPRTGDVITGLPNQKEPNTEVQVFHAGTSLKDEQVLTSGGRVLCVTALGETVKFAQSSAYEMVKKIEFEGAQYRQDIGYRAIKG